ncbi:hypothetical protein D9M71_571820 [compost metagenome]
MGESSRIDQDEVHTLVACGVNAVDQFVFGVALQVLQMVACGAGTLLQVLVDLGQGHGAVVARLAGAEQVEVGAVEHQ